MYCLFFIEENELLERVSLLWRNEHLNHPSQPKSYFLRVLDFLVFIDNIAKTEKYHSFFRRLSSKFLHRDVGSFCVDIKTLITTRSYSSTR